MDNLSKINNKASYYIVTLLRDSVMALLGQSRRRNRWRVVAQLIASEECSQLQHCTDNIPRKINSLPRDRYPYCLPNGATKRQKRIEIKAVHLNVYKENTRLKRLRFGKFSCSVKSIAMCNALYFRALFICSHKNQCVIQLISYI